MYTYFEHVLECNCYWKGEVYENRTTWKPPSRNSQCSMIGYYRKPKYGDMKIKKMQV